MPCGPILSLLCVFGLAVVCAADSLTDVERAEAQAQLQSYRAATQSKPREEAVEKVLAMPRLAREGMLKVVDADATKAAADYLTAFSTTARKIRTARDSKEARNEVKSLRAKIIALGARGDSLTKEAIVKEADPALKRLRELLGASSADAVLKTDTSLTAIRERALSLLKCRESLRNALGVSDGKAYPPGKIEEEEKAIASLPAVVDKDAVKVLEANKKLEKDIQPSEASGIRDLNELRMILGLPVLIIDVKLCEAARGHSKDMVEKKFFDHTSPIKGKETPWQRAQAAGTSASAENIAAGNATGLDANRAWWHSPGHHRNMLGAGHRRIGLGQHDRHWTQMFGG